MKKNPRKSRILCLTAAALLALTTPYQTFAAPEAPPDYDAEKMTRLQDNVMEYGELGDLVREYNPMVQSQITAVYNNSVQQMKDMEATFKKNANTYDRWMKDLRDEYDFSNDEAMKLIGMSAMTDQGQIAESDLQAAIQASGMDPNVLGNYSTYLVNKSTFQAIGNVYHDTAERFEGISTTADLDNAIDQITAGTEQLMNQYNQLLSQRELVEKNKELNAAMYQMKTTQMQAGMTTQVEVLAAQKDMLAAESNLMQIDSGISNIRQTLCMMTGWSWDANPEIGTIPEAAPDRFARMDPEADVVRAMNNNYTVRKTRHSKPKGDNRTRTSFFRTVEETEQKAQAKLHDLYQAVVEKKAASDAADNAFEAAELDRGKAERQHEAGMISEIQYLGTQVSYLQKKSAKETADMALFQAMEDYDWALDGVAAIE